MSENILVPVLGESITEATVAKWLKNTGDAVEADEAIVELETDKVNLSMSPSCFEKYCKTKDSIGQNLICYQYSKKQLPITRILNCDFDTAWGSKIYMVEQSLSRLLGSPVFLSPIFLASYPSTKLLVFALVFWVCFDAIPNLASLAQW